MLCGWEGHRRSGVALAMRHRLHLGLSTYGLKGKFAAGDEHPAYASGHGPFTFSWELNKESGGAYAKWTNKIQKRAWPRSRDPYKIWHSLKHISKTSKATELKFGTRMHRPMDNFSKMDK